jgi:hypothetical protein
MVRIRASAMHRKPTLTISQAKDMCTAHGTGYAVGVRPRSVTTYHSVATTFRPRTPTSSRGARARCRPSPVRPFGVTTNPVRRCVRRVSVDRRFGVIRTISKATARIGRWRPRESSSRATCWAMNVEPKKIPNVSASARIGTIPVRRTAGGRSR